MNHRTAKSLIIIFFLVGIIAFIIMIVMKTKVRKQPNKQEAYDKGLGYYTVEESLGCRNTSNKCTEPATETLVQYCIPNPVTGRGCIDLEGNETFNMVIRKKPCNIQCVSNKFSVEDGVQVSTNKNGRVTSVTGSGCNKVISEKFGIDYTDYFLGEYNQATDKYELKNCLPNDERFQTYFQKTLTCTENDTKGPNNCNLVCGNEPGVLGLTGILDVENGQTLLKYFPTELDYTGNIRHVCYDINDIDQVDILNYTSEIPDDFVYPNLCYKHTNVLNYNGDLWPNSDAKNVFPLPLTAYQPDSEYISINKNQFDDLENKGLISKDYDIFKDFNSYAKIFLGNEMVMLNTILKGEYVANVYQNTINDKVNSNMSSNIFYFRVTTSTNLVILENVTTVRLNKMVENAEFETLRIDNNITNFVDKKNLLPSRSLYLAINFGKLEKTEKNNFISLSPKRKETTTRGLISNGIFYPINICVKLLNRGGIENIYISFTFDRDTNRIFGNKETSLYDYLNGVKNSKMLYFEYEFESESSKEKKYNYIFISYSDVNIFNLTPSSINSPVARYTITITKIDQGYKHFKGDFQNSSKFNITSGIYLFGKDMSSDTLTLTTVTTSALDGNSLKLDLNRYSYRTGNIKIENNNFLYPRTQKIENMYAILNYTPEVFLSNYNDLTNGNYGAYNKKSLVSFSSGNPWTYKIVGEKQTGNLNFTFIKKNTYSTIISGDTIRFTIKKNNGWVINDDANSITNLTSNSLTFTLGGKTYVLTSRSAMLLTTLFYVHGNRILNGETDTNNYFWYPIMVSKTENVSNTGKQVINFTQFPIYSINNFLSLVSNDSITFNEFSPPESNEEFTYLCFNDEIGAADCIIEPVILGLVGDNNCWTFRNATRRTNLGSYKFKNSYDNKLILSNYKYNGFDSSLFTFVSFKQESEGEGVLITAERAKTQTLKIIRKESNYFDLLFNQTKELELTEYKDKKLREYMTMIANQNTGYNEIEMSEDNFKVILFPQKTVTIVADYRVFKSPYTIDENNNYNFLCYNQNGIPLPNGTRVDLGNNQKIIYNKFCTTGLNVEGSDKCGVLGINSDPNDNDSVITNCIQKRVTQNPNFVNDCLVYTKDKYNTLANLFESGIILREMKKANNFGERENKQVNVFDTFFTREEEDSVKYKPEEELYLNKNKQNFFISLKKDNLDFVVKPSSWERIFPYQNLTKSSVFQNHLYTQSLLTRKNPYNLYLGTVATTVGQTLAVLSESQNKNNTVYNNKIVAENFDHRLVYKNATTGINTQNYFDSGVQFYYDSNNGADYRLMARYGTVQHLFSLKNGRPASFFAKKVGFNLIKPKPTVYVPNLLGIKYGTGNWFNTIEHMLQGGIIAPKDVDLSQYREESGEINFTGSYDEVTQTYNLFSERGENYQKIDTDDAKALIYQNDITYYAFGEIVEVTTEEKTENKLKITIRDFNLNKSYNNIVAGDYVSIGDNFYGPILSTLLGDKIILWEYPDMPPPNFDQKFKYPKLDGTRDAVGTKRPNYEYSANQINNGQWMGPYFGFDPNYVIPEGKKRPVSPGGKAQNLKKYQKILDITKNRSLSITSDAYKKDQTQDIISSSKKGSIITFFVNNLTYDKDLLPKETTIVFTTVNHIPSDEENKKTTEEKFSELKQKISMELNDIIAIYPNLDQFAANGYKIYIDKDGKTTEKTTETKGRTRIKGGSISRESYLNRWEQFREPFLESSGCIVLPEFVRVISFEEDPDAASITIVLERNIKNTPRENLIKLDNSKLSSLEKKDRESFLSVMDTKLFPINLKKGGTLINGFAQIQEISDNSVSFFLEIDNFTINVSSGETKPDSDNYDFYSTKLFNATSGYTYPESQFPLQMSNYQLSMRYIKQEIQIGYSQISENLFASITRKDDFQYYDTKLLSYVTGYKRDLTNKKYYFNEFREDYSYGNPQISLTFSIGDQIEYITKSPLEKLTSTGVGYTESVVGIFEITNINVTKYLPTPTNFNTVDITWDYECKLIKSFNTQRTNDPQGQMSGNRVTFFQNERNSAFSRDISGRGKPIYYTTYLQVPNSSTNEAGKGGEVYLLLHAVLPLIDGTDKDGNKILKPYDDEVNTLVLGQVYGKTRANGNVIVQELEFTFKDGRGTIQRKGFIGGNNGLEPYKINHDYYKLLTNIQLPNSVSEPTYSSGMNEIAASTGSEMMTNNAYASQVGYPGGFIRGNKLDVLKLRSTTLRSVKNNNDYIKIKIISMSGKPYGSEFVMNVNKTQYPNHNRLGTVLDFDIIGSKLDNSQVGDVFESNKGFDIILTDMKPSKYEFVSISENSEIKPYNLQTFQESSPYYKGAITSVIDRNTRQYFRNTSGVSSQFSFNQQNTNNFEIIPRTIFSEDIFIDYRKDLYYQQGELVNLQDDPRELSGLYSAIRSNYGISISFDNSDFWDYDIFTENLKSDNQRFYSFNYPEKTIQGGTSLNNFIEKNKTLNALNLPFQLKNTDNENYCPNFCGFISPKPIPQIIEESFISSVGYFDPIKHLFDSPVLLKKSNSQKFLTLGNVPVTYDKDENYNVTFLANSDDRANLLSQFVYFLDLDNDKKIYNKRECTGNFEYYGINKPEEGVDSGVSKFAFSNSLLFQFIPCDLDSQDYISYGVSSGSSIITLKDDIMYSYKTPSENISTGVPLILEENNNFSGISGTFNTSYITSNVTQDEIGPSGFETLSEEGGGDEKIDIIVEDYSFNLLGKIKVNSGGGGKNLSYGDIWYLIQSGDKIPEEEKEILTYGFVIPEGTDNGVTKNSFIQIQDVFQVPNKCEIKVISEKGSGVGMGTMEIQQKTINKFRLTKSSETLTKGRKTFTSSKNLKVSVYVDKNGEIVQPNQAYFTSSSNYNSSNGTIYLPSYDIKKNIKVKALAKFGNSYLGRIKYNNFGFKSLENKILPATIFDIYSNTIFTNNLANDTTIVLSENQNLELNYMTDVLMINFEPDGKFGFKINHFNKPIKAPKSNLINLSVNNMGAVNSNSVNAVVPIEINNMEGVSVKLSFIDIINDNEKYDPGNNLIPGNTNTQIQIEEIREYRTNDFIDPTNNCSLYFNNELLPETGLDGDTVFNTNIRQNQGGFVIVDVTQQNPYSRNGSPNVERFKLDFKNNIEYVSNEELTFQLGNNLIYHFDQTGKINDNKPMVFSTGSGDDFKDNIISSLEKTLGKGKIKFEYFLDFKEVSQSEYVNSQNFNNAEEERKIKIEFISDFDVIDLGVTNLFYGFNQNNGQLNGGKFNFIYH